MIGLKRNIKSGLGSIRNFGAFIDIRFQGRYNVVNVVDEEVVILSSLPSSDVVKCVCLGSLLNSFRSVH